MKNKIKKILSEEKTYWILFIVSTIYFLYFHKAIVSWDFQVYSMNAQYWLGASNYFEPFRPPLVPAILVLFGFVGSVAAEYLFVILTSVVFCFSTKKLAEVLNLNKVVFYALSLNVFVLGLGMFTGTELLYVALIELAIAYALQKKALSGIALGFSILTRYTGISMIPLVLLNKDKKKILKSFFAIALPILPWLAYSYYKWGNFLTSFSDQYANNILLRSGMYWPMSAVKILIAYNILLPFFIIGLGLFIIALAKDLKSKDLFKLLDKHKVNIVMIYLFIFATYSYISIPYRQIRYMFLGVIPIVYYSYLGLQYVCSKTKKDFKKIAIVIAILSLLASTAYVYDQSQHNALTIYEQPLDKLEELNKSDCMLSSNAWVITNYLGKITKEHPRPELMNQSINNGELVLIYHHIIEPEYAQNKTFLNQFPILYETPQYVLLGKEDACMSEKPVDNQFMEKYQSIISDIYGYEVNINPCFVMFRNISILEKTCNLINYGNFTTDENRAIG